MMHVISRFVPLAESASDIGASYGHLVFMGLFIIALMIVGIWWLQR
jgi:hypothetical protein